MVGDKLQEIYELLLGRFGEQKWWPGDGEFEVIVGAILTQNTNWANVEKAIGNLKRADVLSAEKLYKLDSDRLAELIRPAGYYNVKAKRLRNFLGWFFENYGGDVAALAKGDTNSLREELLSVNGIGAETADSILLYGLGKPVFVVDSYTARIMVRHGLIDQCFDYMQLQELFMDNLPCDVKMFNEYHALIVQCGKEYCRPRAKCAGCPLEGLEHCLEQEY